MSVRGSISPSSDHQLQAGGLEPKGFIFSQTIFSFRHLILDGLQNENKDKIFDSFWQPGNFSLFLMDLKQGWESGRFF